MSDVGANQAYAAPARAPSRLPPCDLTKSYGPNDFSEQFGYGADEAGLPERCVFHGLRKAALTRLAEAGCTVHQIAAVSGHKTLKEIERYTKAADQRRLAREALLGEQDGESNAPQRKKA
jgi:integrase